MNIIQEARNILGESIAAPEPAAAQIALEPEIKEVDANAQNQNEIPKEGAREEEGDAGIGEGYEDEQGKGKEEVLAGEGEASDTYSVASLAEAIGFETKELYETLEVSLDDGQPPMPLGDLKNAHQNLVRDHNNLKAELETAQNNNAQSANAPSSEMAQIEAYVRQLNQEENGIDWVDLEVTDPGQAALDRGRFQQKRTQAQNAYNQLQLQEAQADQENRNEESKKILESIPAWSDPSVRAKDQGEMMEYMKSIGFNQAEVNGFADHRVYKMMKEIIDSRRLKSDASKAAKRVSKAPKMLNGSRKAPKINQSQATDNLVKKARSSRNKNDQLAAAKALFSAR